MTIKASKASRRKTSSDPLALLQEAIDEFELFGPRKVLTQVTGQRIVETDDDEPSPPSTSSKEAPLSRQLSPSPSPPLPSASPTYTQIIRSTTKSEATMPTAIRKFHGSTSHELSSEESGCKSNPANTQEAEEDTRVVQKFVPFLIRLAGYCTLFGQLSLSSCLLFSASTKCRSQDWSPTEP